MIVLESGHCLRLVKSCKHVASSVDEGLRQRGVQGQCHCCGGGQSFAVQVQKSSSFEAVSVSPCLSLSLSHFPLSFLSPLLLSSLSLLLFCSSLLLLLSFWKYYTLLLFALSLLSLCSLSLLTVVSKSCEVFWLAVASSVRRKEGHCIVSCCMVYVDKTHQHAPTF